MGTWTDRSSTVTTGGTSQVLAAANTDRVRLYVLNPPSANGSIFINFTDPASTSNGKSIELSPGSYYDTSGGPVTLEAVNVTAASTGQKYTAKEMVP